MQYQPIENQKSNKETTLDLNEQYILTCYQDFRNSAGWQALHELILGGASFSQLLREMNNLGLDAFFINETSIPGEANLWTFQHEVDHPINRKWKIILNAVEIRKRRLLFKKRRFLNICEKAEQQIGRIQLMQEECLKLAGLLGIDIDKNVVNDYLKYVRFDPNLPRGYSTYEQDTPRARITLADPVSYPPHFLLLMTKRNEDISILRHEFVHEMKRRGLIDHDIGIPIASAVTVLSLDLNSGIDPLSFEPISYDDLMLASNRIKLLMAELNGNIDSVFCAWVFDLAPYVVSTVGHESIINFFREKDETDRQINPEPLESYVYGRRLALFTRWVSTHYRIDKFRFVGKLAAGTMPSAILDDAITTHPSDPETPATEFPA